MANTFHITAGLPVAKDSGQSPTSGVNTFYVSAGLVPDVEEDVPTPIATTSISSNIFSQVKTIFKSFIRSSV